MQQGIYHFKNLARAAGILALLAICFLMPVIVLADETEKSPLLIELNTKQQDGENCRLVFIGSNKTGQTIDKLSFETVLFNKQATFLRLALFDFESLPHSKTRVRQFAIPNLQCSELGRILVNGVSTCTIAGNKAALCEKHLTVTTKTDTELLG